MTNPLSAVPQSDLDIVLACANLVGRSGGRNFQIGYLHDGVPMAEAGWYVHAQYQGHRMTEEGPGPAQAAQALCLRILKGAKCLCGKLVTLNPAGGFAYREVTLADGSRWTAAEAAKVGQCLWRLAGQRFVRGCEQGRRGAGEP